MARAIVLLPGLDGTGELFEPTLPLLARRFDDVRVARYSRDQVQGYDALLDEVLGTLPSEPYVLVGESFSGPLALRAAALAPRTPSAVVLVASFVTNPIAWAPPWLAFLVRPAAFRLGLPVALLRRYLVGDDAPAELVAKVGSAVRSVRPEVMAARAREVLAVDATEALVACPAPVLYLAGSRDRLVGRPVLTGLRSARPNLRVREVDAPHLVLQRDPARAASALLDLLADPEC